MAAYFGLISLSIIALSLGSRDSNSPYGSDEEEEPFPLTIASPPSKPPTKSRRISIDNTRAGLQGMPPSKGAGPSHTLGKADTSERFPAQGTQLWEYLLDKLLCPFTDEREIQWVERNPIREYMFSIPRLDLLTDDWNRYHATAVDDNQLLAALRQLIGRGMLRDYTSFVKSNTYAFLGANAEFKEQYDAKSSRIQCAACNEIHEKRLRPDNLPQIADESASQGGEELWKYIVDLLLCSITQNVVAWDTTHPIHHAYQFTIIDWNQILDRWNLHHVAITYDELLEYIASHTYPNEPLLRIGHADENTYAFYEDSRLFRAYYIQQVQNEKCPICTKSHKKVTPD